MTFKLMAMTAQGQHRTFGFEHTDLEKAYQLLHSITQLGDTLIDAILIDEHGCLPLPLDSFDQPGFLNPIESLRLQWESLLAQPDRGYLSREEVNQRLRNLRQVRIASIRRTINHTQELLERTQDLMEGPRTLSLKSHYQQIVERYSSLLDRLERVID